MQEIFNGNLVLEKYPGKGGWIYTLIESIPKQPKTGKGNWVTVNGKIDGVDLKEIKLWPMGNGKSFLPVKAEIRKIIRKTEGDSVHVILFGEKESPLPNLDDFETALEYEPMAQKFYFQLTKAQKKTVIDFIFSKNDAISQIDQMALALKFLAQKVIPK